MGWLCQSDPGQEPPGADWGPVQALPAVPVGLASICAIIKNTLHTLRKIQQILDTPSKMLEVSN